MSDEAIVIVIADPKDREIHRLRNLLQSKILELSFLKLVSIRKDDRTISARDLAGAFRKVEAKGTR